MLLGESVQTVNEVIVELNKHFFPSHDHMVHHMVNRSDDSEREVRAWLGFPTRRRNTSDNIATTIELPGAQYVVDPAELAAVAFLARYSGRTLDAYRHDLRNLFQWTADHGLPVLEASRAHLEMYRSSMEERGLPPQQ